MELSSNWFLIVIDFLLYSQEIQLAVTLSAQRLFALLTEKKNKYTYT